jgi:hypothetical protein
MNKPSKEDIINKWSSILGPMGMTGSQLANISQLVENQSNHILENQLENEEASIDFSSLLPIAMKVASKTISNELIFASQEEIDQVKNKVQSENRDGKIESIVEGSEFTEKKLEDDEEYKKLMKKGVSPLSAPSGVLHYLDYTYSDNSKTKTHKKTRRAGKKHKKNG